MQPTIAGIRAGADEVLDAAVRYAEKKVGIKAATRRDQRSQEGASRARDCVAAAVASP